LDCNLRFPLTNVETRSEHELPCELSMVNKLCKSFLDKVIKKKEDYC
jgi:hypothetical protein